MIRKGGADMAMYGRVYASNIMMSDSTISGYLETSVRRYGPW